MEPAIPAMGLSYFSNLCEFNLTHSGKVFDVRSHDMHGNEEYSYVFRCWAAYAKESTVYLAIETQDRLYKVVLQSSE